MKGVENQALVTMEALTSDYTKIIDLMCAHPDLATLQQKGCNKLFKIVHDHRKNQITVGRAGGVSAAREAMLYQPHDTLVAEFGSGTLCDMVIGNDTINTIIVEEGGIKVLVGALKRHPSTRASNRWPVTHSSSLPAMTLPSRLLSCFKRGRHLPWELLYASAPMRCKCQIRWLHALASISKSQDSHNKCSIVEGGAITSVVAGMQLHKTNSTVQEYGGTNL
jgi:hypothetical protein